jgi:hypothetical protein
MWETNYVFKTWERKPLGKCPVGRHRKRWEDNIRMYLREKL